jgi:hypothetical protein
MFFKHRAVYDLTEVYPVMGLYSLGQSNLAGRVIVIAD